MPKWPRLTFPCMPVVRNMAGPMFLSDLDPNHKPTLLCKHEEITHLKPEAIGKECNKQ
jgi:hypothetical protein